MKKIDKAEKSFLELCNSMGWKRTVQRRRVFDAIWESRTHPTVEAITQLVRKSLPDISDDSVYRILQDFAKAGLIKQMEGLDIIHFDSNPTPHAHFLCTKCGTVYDIELDLPKLNLPDVCGNIEDMEFRICGICKNCSDK